MSPPRQKKKIKGKSGNTYQKFEIAKVGLERNILNIYIRKEEEIGLMRGQTMAGYPNFYYNTVVSILSRSVAAFMLQWQS